MGLVPLVRDYELRVIEPRTLYGKSSREIRRMLYGRNLNDLSFNRKMGGVKAEPVQVQAYDPTIDRTRFARWPVGADGISTGIIGEGPQPRKQIANQVSPTGTKTDEKYRVFPIKVPSTDATYLLRAAKNLYEQIGRQEMAGSFSTKDCSSWDVATGAPLAYQEADLLKLQSGDPVMLLIAPQDPLRPEQTPSTPAEIAELSQQARVRFLVSKGFSEEVAEWFARLQEAAGFQTVFRTKDVSIEMSPDDGLTISVDFINYVEIRDSYPDEDVEALADAAAVSESLEQRLGGSESESAKKAKKAQRRRRAVAKQRAEGKATKEQYNNAVEIEQNWVEEYDAIDRGQGPLI